VRKLMRALKAQADVGPLIGVRVAVLTLAHSVCAFSSASAGKAKFAAGENLLRALTAAGATALAEVGGTEVELDDVDVSVVPWAQKVREAAGITEACQKIGGLSVVETVHVLHCGGLSLDVAEMIVSGGAVGGFEVKLVSMDDFKAWLSETLLQDDKMSQSPVHAVFIAETVENEQPSERAGACTRFLNRRTHAAGMLSRLHFAVLGLGDSNLLLDRQTTTAKDCNQVAQRLDVRLAELGATSFFARGEADDRTGNEEIEPWVSGLLAAFSRSG